jgi:pyruvate/2-oxoglutarate/acetoin dehydrogenase E1 component
MPRITYAEAFIDGIRSCLADDPHLTVVGRGLFGIEPSGIHEKKLHQEYPDRIIDPPTSEQAIAGLGIGAAMAGVHTFVHMGTASFSLEACNQFINEAAVARYMTNGGVSVPVTFHMFHGVRGGGAAQHSLSPQAMFANNAGLEVVLPSTAYDVKGLIRTALRNPNPTLFLNHTQILGREDEVPAGPYEIPFGQAEVKRAGRDVTLVAFSRMLIRSLEAAELLAREGIEVEVVDPRTAAPLDEAAICASVEKTGRLVTVEESIQSCSVASEIGALVAERAFRALKAPIVRLARRPVPVPFARQLEDFVTPQVADIAAAVRRALKD